LTIQGVMSTEALIQAPRQVEMAFDTLENLDRLTVKQKVSKIQAITAMMGHEWERPCKYKIVDSWGKEIFYAQEATGCCRRQLRNAGCGQCMSWEVQFYHSSLTSREHVFDLHKPWQCSFCCINIPRAHLKAVEDGSDFGYLQEPCCSCCPKFSAHAPNGDTLLTATSHPCQIGIYFPCPCGPCSRVKWDLKDGDGNDLGEVVKKIPLNWCKWACPGQDIDYYHVDLSKLPSSNMKALVMAMTVFIDFRFMAQDEDEEHDAAAATADGGE